MAGSKDVAASPLGNVQLVVLPNDEAEAIEEVVRDAVEAEEVAGETEKSWKRYQDALLRDLLGMLKSSDHTWHFLNALGLHLHSKPLDCKAHARGLLLLHCLLCRGTSPAITRAARKLLDPSSSHDRPALDLHKLSKHLHKHQQPPSSAASGPGNAVEFIVAYCHYLLNRVYCAATVSSRLFAQPGAASAPAGGGGAGSPAGDAAEAEIGLGERFWGQQRDEQVLAKLEALQKLQELLLRCGQAAPAAGSAVLRGAGQAKDSKEGDRLVGKVLELLLEDSFGLYGSINYGLIELMNRFGSMQREQAMRALQSFRRSAQQGQALSELYSSLGQRGVGAGLPFPSVVVLAPSSISNLERMKDGSPSSPDAVTAVQLYPPVQPAPQPAQPAAPAPAPSPSAALVVYDPPSASKPFDLQEALFGPYSAQPAAAAAAPCTPPQAGRPAWEATLDMAVASGQQQHQPGQQPQQHHAQQLQPQQQAQQQVQPAGTPAPSSALTVYSPAAAASFPAGWDQLLLDSLYETAEAQRKVHQAAASRMRHGGAGGAAAGAALQAAGGLAVADTTWGGHANGGVLRIAGPSEDPFAASAHVPAPPYVQMALRAQQQLAMELERRLLFQRSQFLLAVRRGEAAAGGGVAAPGHGHVVMAAPGAGPVAGMGIVASAGPALGGQEAGATYSWTGGGVSYGGVVVPF